MRAVSISSSAPMPSAEVRSPLAQTYRLVAKAMAAAMWNWAVPAA